MKKVHHIGTINEYNEITAKPTRHPLVSFIDFSTINPVRHADRQRSDTQALSFGFYAVFLKEDKNCDIRYGRNYYDYQTGTLIFIAPGQVVSIEEDGDDYQPSGYALLFHPDLIRGTGLGHNMKNYSFFSYSVHEALHLSAEEKQTILDCFKKIENELQRSVDKHSKKLIAANIELFLSYCDRFYDRQFIIRDQANNGILEKFETLLSKYFETNTPQTKGIPSVAYFANELHLSANYFGDLIKKETGKTALDHIQAKLIDAAKEKLFNTGKTISEIAYELGFAYPQHFTRFFKQHAGSSPSAYRAPD
jgi:AraC-like DNA-binding protein